MPARESMRPVKRQKKPSALARGVMMASIVAVVGVASAFILKKPEPGRADPVPTERIDEGPASEGGGVGGWLSRLRPSRPETRREVEPAARAARAKRENPADEARPARTRKPGAEVPSWKERVRAMRRGDAKPPPFPTDPLEDERPKRKYELEELPGQPPMLMVFSHPPGARLKVNGHIWGLTPFVRAVSREMVRLEVELSSPGYRTLERSLTPDDKGRFQLGVVMEPIEE